jgi:hypothetical protein
MRGGELQEKHLVLFGLSPVIISGYVLPPFGCDALGAAAGIVCSSTVISTQRRREKRPQLDPVSPDRAASFFLFALQFRGLEGSGGQ